MSERKQTDRTGANDAQNAFDRAIHAGRLSAHADAPNYAGRYMFMGQRDGIDTFKHIDTREYLTTA